MYYESGSYSSFDSIPGHGPGVGFCVLYERIILSSGNYGQEYDAEPEKHLLIQDAVDTLLDSPVAKGVQKFRTP